MTDITNILKAAGLMLTLSRQFAQVFREWRDMIETARKENRDLTDGELEMLRARSRNALEQWKDMDAQGDS